MIKYLILTLTLYFWACETKGELTGNAVQTGNPQLTLKIFKPSGEAADSAKVELFKTSETEVFETYVADENGVVRLNQLEGRYNLWIAKDGLISFLPDILFEEGLVAKRETTLQKPSLLMGTIAGSDQELSISISGSGLKTQTNEVGEFKMMGIIPSTYSIQIESSEGMYVYTINLNGVGITKGQIGENQYFFDLGVIQYEYLMQGGGMSSDAVVSSSESFPSSQNLITSSSEEISSSSRIIEYGELLDTRDGQVYKTTKIGSQIWMAENLNYDSGEGSFCTEEGMGNCPGWGRLYYSENAMAGEASSDLVPSGVQGICPDGWHIPSNQEWEIMAEYVAIETGLTERDSTDWLQIGSNLKADADWRLDTPNTNDFGFSALPAGSMFKGIHVFYFDGTNFLTTTEFLSFEDSSTRYFMTRSLVYLNDKFSNYALSTQSTFSVRCVMD